MLHFRADNPGYFAQIKEVKCKTVKMSRVFFVYVYNITINQHYIQLVKVGRNKRLKKDTLQILK